MMEKKTLDPFQFMIENREIINAVVMNSTTLIHAWEMLHESLPTIRDALKFNTFKTYARFINVVGKELDKQSFIMIELDKVRQEKDKIEKELDKVRQEKDKIEKELGKVRQILPNKKNVSKKQVIIPKNIDGWGVQRKNCYYRLFKKIDKKVKWIHIGKEWNLEVAKKKISNFQSKQK